MALDSFQLVHGASDLADHLLLQLKEERLPRIDVETVRAAVAGYTLDKAPAAGQREDLEERVLRHIVVRAG